MPKKFIGFDIAFQRFQEFLKINTEDDFTYDPEGDISYLFKDINQNKMFYEKFFEPNTNAKKIWVVGTTNNTARTLESTGVRILESGYIDQANKGHHPFFGGYKDKRTGKQFIDITIAVTTSKKIAERRAKDQIQDLIIGVDSKGIADPVFLEARRLPEQGSEPIL